jgi:branched-chain amino acid transport system permease protein
METLIQAVLDGLCIGAIYGLGAMGLVVIQKSSGVFNMSHGMLMMFGAYIAAMIALPMGMPMWVAALVAMVVSALVGWGVNLIIFRQLMGESVFTQLMATIGLLSILYGITLGIWGTFPHVYPSDILPTGDLIFGPYKVSSAYVNGFIIAGLACLFLTF